MEDSKAMVLLAVRILSLAVAMTEKENRERG